MTRLLDINLLMALAWERHEHHRAAKQWFKGVDRFATCPITELGFVRISANPAIGFALDVKTARSALRAFASSRAHKFWPDALAVLHPGLPSARGHRQLTDAYLVGLAVDQGGCLATLDRGVAHLPGVKQGQVETVPVGAGRA